MWVRRLRGKARQRTRCGFDWVMRTPGTSERLAREDAMAELLRVFDTTLTTADGRSFRARACGAPIGDGRWEAWVEFFSSDGSGAIRTARETTQPSRTGLIYWANGLRSVYLEGALRRALSSQPRENRHQGEGLLSRSRTGSRPRRHPGS